MAVDVVDGDEDEDGMIKGVLRIVRVEDEIAEESQAGVFAVHFAGMDGVLNEEDGAAGRMDGGGIEDAIFRDDDDLEVAAFAGFAEVFNVDELRVGGGDALDVGDGLGVVGGGAVVGDFGGGAPIGRLGGSGTKAGRQRGEE